MIKLKEYKWCYSLILEEKKCWLGICFFWPQIIKRKVNWEYAVPTMDDVEKTSKWITQHVMVLKGEK